MLPDNHNHIWRSTSRPTSVQPSFVAPTIPTRAVARVTFSGSDRLQCPLEDGAAAPYCVMSAMFQHLLDRTERHNSSGTQIRVASNLYRNCGTEDLFPERRLSSDCGRRCSSPIVASVPLWLRTNLTTLFLWPFLIHLGWIIDANPLKEIDRATATATTTPTATATTTAAATVVPLDTSTLALPYKHVCKQRWLTPRRSVARCCLI